MPSNKEQLLIANFKESGYYANATIHNFFIVTAWHVARSTLSISTPDNNEVGTFSFRKVHPRDLAVSRQLIQAEGFNRVIVPQIGLEVTMIGHHGEDKKYFEINAQVVGFDDLGRIIIERKNGKVFQLGMSGSPVFDGENNFLGVLVAGVNGTNGEKAYLEPASSLL